MIRPLPPEFHRIGVAVSGGADSVCLLYLLLETGRELTVLHLNHLARGAESDGDAAFVRDLAARLNLPLLYREQRIPKDENFEQAARQARHAFFAECLEHLDCVATGHTLSDQAETVLYRFLRGAGTAGLAGILPTTAERIVRPLLNATRAEVEDWLRARGIPWREDSTNRDLRFARNRIRHELLPALTRDWNPALPETLARMAAIAQDEEVYWAGVVKPLAAERLILHPPAVLFRAEALTGLAPAVARRLARRALELAKGDLRSIDLLHVEALLRLASSTEGSGRFQAPGLDVLRSFDWVRIAPARGTERPDYRFPLPVPGEVGIPGTPTRIETELAEIKAISDLDVSDGKSRYNMRDSALDWERISGAPEVRNWKPGDRYRPAGYLRETKVKSLFQEARVPLWSRRHWPVITCGENIVWTARFGPAAEYAVTPETRTVLRVRELGSLTEF